MFRHENRKKARGSRKLSTYFNYLQERWGKSEVIQHVCNLADQQKQTEIVNEIIDSGIFINARRKFRKLFMISQRHPYTPRIFRSKTEIRQEEVRHLVLYKFMMHPFSVGCLYWDFFYAAALLVYYCIILPKDFVLVRFYVEIKWAKFAFDLITSIDIFLNLFRGYYDRNKVKVIMKPRKVAIHYLTTYFAWDVLSCVPSYLIYWYITARGPSPIGLTKWLSLFKLCRVPTVEASMEKYKFYAGYSSTSFEISKLIFRVYICILFFISLICFIKQYKYTNLYISRHEDLIGALENMYYTVTLTFGVGYMRKSENSFEAVAAIVILMIGILLRLYVISRIYILWQRFVITSDMSEDLSQQLHSFMKYKALPVDLRAELHSYFDFRFQKQFFNDAKILDMFSFNLRQVCHLEDGQNYGACAAVLGEVRKMTLVAVSPCEVFMLRKRELMRALDPFPELKDYVVEMALKMLKENAKTFSF
ncbi:potassium/sodium hyperpolarization-activated cyclic nucleotide-gated channel 2-like isoform X2 [Cylas formicarius]|uniref:potassium/sodium hyperpolarization-activated cyclic nucleotide-gated channel 2-like isoform X2 n=1 Tax=Cylas formicarius TaxID=197179 RepID=UPI0029585AB7|nr:potassium/sodium hyperpolarization-activated cyclic nucleotide-gated channel 2-like isoform X2 [Cylas formicarius]